MCQVTLRLPAKQDQPHWRRLEPGSVVQDAGTGLLRQGRSEQRKNNHTNDTGQATMTSNGLQTERSRFRAALTGEAEWLYDLRKRGWEYYNDSPLPDRVKHLWKYTDPNAFVWDNLEQQLAVHPEMANGRQRDGKPVEEGYAAHGYTRDDRVSVARVPDELAERGLVLMDLYTAASRHPELVEPYLGQVVGPEYDKFESLNAALWNSGMLLYIPRNLTLEKPIYLQRTPTGLNTISRLLIVAEENSEVTVINDYNGGHGEGQINGVQEVFAGPNARFNLVTIQRLGTGYTTHLTHRAKLGAQATYKGVSVNLGGANTKMDLGGILDGPGADSRWYGLLFGSSEQHFDVHTVHRHNAGDTYSNLDYMVALKDKAVSAYTGMIRIDPGATNCEAYQENRNLLLNDGARAESIPELEIENDEVSCSHGVTVGKIDPEMIFYLTSRGVDPVDAVKMIVYGFYQPVLSKIGGSFEELSRELLMEKLAG
ncbi:Fe-S cluster assembly protein SufD [bacterium]|nr:Fe-S cluster assembly protein SufD [bacterium]